MPQRVVCVQEPHTIGSGTGILFIGPEHTSLRADWPDKTNFQEVGSLEGDLEVVRAREFLEIYDGQPLRLIQKECVRESARISCVTKERRLQQVAQFMGFASSKPAFSAGGSVSITEEYVALFGQSWAHLIQRNVSGVVVKSLDATPVTYVENTDYVLDATEGTIRRTGDGSIADGEVVTVSYSYTAPPIRTLKFGGDTQVTKHSLLFIYQQPQNKSRVLYVFPKAAPADALTSAFRQGSLNTKNLVFDAIADLTASPGEDLMWEIHENEVSEAYQTDTP